MARTPWKKFAAPVAPLAAVSDDEIREGIRLLARTEGVFAETAGGVTVAVLAKLVSSGVVHPDERVVAFITGNGLKTTDAVSAKLRPDGYDRAEPGGFRGRRPCPGLGGHPPGAT